MTILGVDYGRKRVGIALSDATETLAFPHDTLAHSSQLSDELAQLCSEKNARIIVFGHSQNFQGKDNLIMQDVHALQKILEAKNIVVCLEPEFLSSVEARKIQGRTAHTDASAAALILQRFLDKQRFRAQNN